MVRNKQRNPNIAGILTGYGYTEQIGEGMQLFKRKCNRHPLKPKYPAYREWVDTTVTVLYPAEVGVQKEGRISFGGLNERQKKAIAYIREKGKTTNREYQKLNEVSNKTAYKDLLELLNKGILLAKGGNRNK